MSSICRYYEECFLRNVECNPYSCDACGNVSFEWWEGGSPTGMMYEGPCCMYEPMPDVEALITLADQLEGMDVGHVVTRAGAARIARTIRMALGERRDPKKSLAYMRLARGEDDGRKD